MRTIRPHLVGVILALVGAVTSMPQTPHRGHASALRGQPQVQLDDDDDDREAELAILDEEEPDAGAGAQRRRPEY